MSSRPNPMVHHHGTSASAPVPSTMPCLATTAAAAWINKVLEETELEWLLWVDLDTVIIDASFVFPFKRFRDADLVVYGDEDGTRAGDPAEGQAVSCQGGADVGCLLHVQKLVGLPIQL